MKKALAALGGLLCFFLILSSCTAFLRPRPVYSFNVSLEVPPIVDSGARLIAPGTDTIEAELSGDGIDVPIRVSQPYTAGSLQVSLSFSEVPGGFERTLIVYAKSSGVPVSYGSLVFDLDPTLPTERLTLKLIPYLPQDTAVDLSNITQAWPHPFAKSLAPGVLTSFRFVPQFTNAKNLMTLRITVATPAAVDVFLQDSQGGFLKDSLGNTLLQASYTDTGQQGANYALMLPIVTSGETYYLSVLTKNLTGKSDPYIPVVIQIRDQSQNLASDAGFSLTSVQLGANSFPGALDTTQQGGDPTYTAPSLPIGADLKSVSLSVVLNSSKAKLLELSGGPGPSWTASYLGLGSSTVGTLDFTGASNPRPLMVVAPDGSVKTYRVALGLTATTYDITAPSPPPMGGRVASGGKVYLKMTSATARSLSATLSSEKATSMKIYDDTSPLPQLLGTLSYFQNPVQPNFDFAASAGRSFYLEVSTTDPAGSSFVVWVRDQKSAPSSVNDLSAVSLTVAAGNFPAVMDTSSGGSGTKKWNADIPLGTDKTLTKLNFTPVNAATQVFCWSGDPAVGTVSPLSPISSGATIDFKSVPEQDFMTVAEDGKLNFFRVVSTLFTPLEVNTSQEPLFTTSPAAGVTRVKITPTSTKTLAVFVASQVNQTLLVKNADGSPGPTQLFANNGPHVPMDLPVNANSDYYLEMSNGSGSVNGFILWVKDKKTSYDSQNDLTSLIVSFAGNSYGARFPSSQGFVGSGDAPLMIDVPAGTATGTGSIAGISLSGTATRAYQIWDTKPGVPLSGGSTIDFTDPTGKARLLVLAEDAGVKTYSAMAGVPPTLSIPDYIQVENAIAAFQGIYNLQRDVSGNAVLCDGVPTFKKDPQSYIPNGLYLFRTTDTVSGNHYWVVDDTGPLSSSPVSSAYVYLMKNLVSSPDQGTDWNAPAAASFGTGGSISAGTITSGMKALKYYAATGELLAGTSLTPTYVFTAQSGSGEGASVLSWYWSNSSNGPWNATSVANVVKSGTATDLNLGFSDAGNYFRYTMFPIDSRGYVGSLVDSANFGSVGILGPASGLGWVGSASVSKDIPTAGTLGGSGVGMQNKLTIAGASDGKIYLGYVDTESGTDLLYVKAYNPATQAWQNLGGAVNSGVSALGAKLLVNSSNEPILLYQTGTTVTVQKWTGASWSVLGTLTTQTGPAPDMTLIGDAPVVSYNTASAPYTTIAVLNSGTFQNLANQPSWVGSPTSLKLLSTGGTLLCAFTDSAGVKVFSTGDLGVTAWSDLSFNPGASWSSAVTSPSEVVDFQVDSGGNLYLLDRYGSAGSYKLALAAKIGASWWISGSLDFAAADVSNAVWALGSPAGSSYRILVKGSYAKAYLWEASGISLTKKTTFFTRQKDPLLLGIGRDSSGKSVYAEMYFNGGLGVYSYP